MADGLTDNIITGCQQQLAVDVTSRNSTFVYKNQPVAITNVANELNVAYVLEGSIQKQANTFRITAQLINAPDDSHLWADHFDRTEDDAFGLQDELTGTIVTAINGVLTQPEADSEKTSSTSLVHSVAKLPSMVLFTVVGIGLLAVLLTVLTLLPDLYVIPGLSFNLSFELLSGGLLIVTLVGMFTCYLWHRSRKSSVDVTATLEQIEDHIQHNQFAEAFGLAMSIEHQLDTAQYDTSWWDTFSYPGDLHTEPEDATVHWRPYNGHNVPWKNLGKGPLRNVRLPLGNLQFRLEHPAYVSQEFAVGNRSVNLDNQMFTTSDIEGMEEAGKLVLSRTDEEGMVFARERVLLLALTGTPFSGAKQVKSFFIDQHPVSNEAFKQFVDADGYANHEYWRNLPWPSGANWEQMVGQFLDKTEQPGPANWELGCYPDGEGELPVTGVSWFEAAAYAAFAGKRLPTVDEWARAALPVDAATTPISVAMMNFSNFMGKGKSAPGDFPALSATGTYDMFGNVREWTWNEVAEGRSNLGGCDSDLAYFAVWLNSEDPFIRDDCHGFRCVKGDADPKQLAKINRVDRTYEGEEPVKDDVYEALVQPLRPRRQPTQYEFVEEQEAFAGVTLQKYTIDSGYQERIPLFMIKPAATKPSPVLVLFPGMGSFMGTSGETDAIDLAGRPAFIITQLGYTIILPYWSGAFERFDCGPFPQGEGINAGSLWMERTRRWVQEASQAITFAEEHLETDGERVGFLGISYGANNSIPVLALEDRFRTALLFSGNLMSHPMFPFTDSLNYYPRVTLPTLFINGRYDTIVSANEALFDRRMAWLGTPAEHKKQVLYDAGHWPFPQHLFKKEVADWLKAYL